MAKKIYISGDHAGFELKEKIKKWLTKKGYTMGDHGPFEYKDGDDYPDFVVPMARAMAKELKTNKNAKGIIVAGSGQGENIAVNKIKRIKCALYHGGSPRIVKTSRSHDDANILSFGSRFVTEAEARKAIDIFLKTPFDKGRHLRRVKKVSELGGR